MRPIDAPPEAGYAERIAFVVELVNAAFLREFGVLLTAILLAGRTASAFTAQIGMMVNREEVDAIRVLGLDPVDLLVIPRVLALLAMLPLLTFIAMIAGLAGGMAVGAFTLDIPAVAYFARMQEMMETRHFVVGMVKAPVFAVLFRAHRRDYPLVMLAAISGYLISRHGGEAFGPQAGVFLAALVTTAAGNAYARWMNRPGALIRLPGIIMLVPGSVALRGVISLVQAQDLGAGQEAAMAALNTLMALLAGLLFGNLLVSARRNL